MAGYHRELEYETDWRRLQTKAQKGNWTSTLATLSNWKWYSNASSNRNPSSNRSLHDTGNCLCSDKCSLPKCRERCEVAASIRKSVRWGFIDKTCRFVIEPKYIRVKIFLDSGTTAVEDSTACYQIDRTGKQLSKTISRMQLHKELNEKRWAREAKEKEEDKLHAFKGDIFDAEGKRLIAEKKTLK